MFSEELGGNVSRKRAEEAKERRKRLLQNKKAVATRTNLVTTSTPSPTLVTPIKSNTLSSTTTLASAPLATSLAPGAPPASALETAALQRQRRAWQASQHAAATRIQARVRGRKGRTKLIQSQFTSLQGKLRDIVTLQTMLQQTSTSSTFSIPTATSTNLLRQFLFLDSTLHDGQGLPRKLQVLTTQLPTLCEQLVTCLVLPGLLESSQTNSPCVLSSWLRSNDIAVGSYRLRRWLHSLVRHSTSRTTTVSQGMVLQQCLSALLDQGGENESQLTRTCRWYMLHPTVAHESLSLVAVLRRHLLSLRDKPIPTDANDKREATFSTSDQNRMGGFFMLVLDAVLNDTNRCIQARFVQDILTIPLLTWRISTIALQRLVEPLFPHRFPRLIVLLQAFAEEHCIALNNGQMESLLGHADLPMSICGATGAQRLLANCLVLARLIPACNGTAHVKRTLYPDEMAAATILFQFITTLVHSVPLGTLTSRESAIAWISVGDGNQKAIVLSPTILEQCQVLLVDSFVRRLWTSALEAAGLWQPHTTNAILATKTDRDLVLEQQLAETGNSSAASLAAKEARVNRNKSFWESSKWARKLTKGVTQLLQSNSSDGPQSTAHRDETRVTPGVLSDTSSQSRQLAEGNQADAGTGNGKDCVYSSDLLMALVRLYSTLLARWGGGGNDDIVARSSSPHRASGARVDSRAATSTSEPWVKSLLNVLCFSTPIVRVSWGMLQSNSTKAAELDALVDSDKRRKSLKSLCIQSEYSSPIPRSASNLANVEQSGTAALFYLFLCTFSHLLIITDDVEIHDMDRPLPLHQIRRCIQVLKKLLYRATCVDTGLVVTQVGSSPTADAMELSTYFGLALIAASSRTMRDLYDRSSRRPICVPNLWIVPSLMENEIGRCKTFDDYQSLLTTSPVFRVCPYMVSFKRRLKLFERIITVSRVEIQGENSSNPFHTNPLKPGIPVRIQRDRLLEDGIATMNNLGTNMRQRIAVQYYNEAGARETGIDAGGLFKEFWTDLCAIAFDPNYALFRTTDSNCLYPNPSSISAHGSDHTTLFAFLGRILGKALYEGITIHPKFAHFFLSFLKGDYNFLHMLPDLSTVDSQLYNNLMFLKTYDGDAADLTLSYTVTVDEFGGTKEIPLMRNGANIDVTNDNKQLYIGLVAKFYVYDRIREQSEAMTRGLFEVVDRSWLRLFNEPELQVLISGSSEGKLDIDDMKAHCQYAGGYSSLDRTVAKFWKVVASLDEKQQGALLRFVTSCERAPPLGFGSLNPPLTIHRVGILRDGDRLPTASTCFNVLKLPTYSSEKVLRDRLLYAIESGAGFELS